MCSSLEICHTGCLICTSDDNTLTQCNTLQHNATHTGCLICTSDDTATHSHNATHCNKHRKPFLHVKSRQDCLSARLSFRNAPQHTSTHRNTLTHSSTLQHTATHATGCTRHRMPHLCTSLSATALLAINQGATHCNTL